MDLKKYLNHFLKKVVLKTVDFVDGFDDVEVHLHDDSNKITMDINFYLDKKWADIMIMPEYKRKVFSGQPLSMSELNKYVYNSADYEQRQLINKIIQFFTMIGYEIDFRRVPFNFTYIINPN
jgi:hypothetical protein